MRKRYQIIVAVLTVAIIALCLFGISNLDKAKIRISTTSPIVSSEYSSAESQTQIQTELTAESSIGEASTSLETPDMQRETTASSEIDLSSSAEGTSAAQSETVPSSALMPYPIAFGEHNNTANSAKSTVFFTSIISADGLEKIFNALNVSLPGKVAVKLSTGESSASNYLRPELVGSLVQSLNGTIVECNTAYGGVRSSTALHKQLVKDRGFTQIADVDIMDENGSIKLPITDGAYLSYNMVGSHFANYDSFISLAHFKGHPMAGFGGSIKNVSIGIASRQGKCRIHTAGKSDVVMLGTDQDAFLECMADAAKSVSDALGGNIVYINVMNKLSVDCDCVALPASPEMADVGILASLDPVALDQACVDIVYSQKDGDGGSLVRRMENLNGLHTLERAEQIGLGSRNYTLTSID